jgi:two-component system NtrC family sensor kinase
MVTIAINGLALRPRYPLILTAGILLIMTGSLLLGLRDPLTTISDSFVELTPAPGELSLFLYLGAMLLILVCGAVTVLITVLSRKTVHKAVQLERVNIALAESQADVVIEQKIAALTELAAGLSHELNNPLGAMSSTAATTSRLAARVRDILTTESGLELEDNRKLWRTLDSLEASAEVAQEAGHRIFKVAETLRQFIRLDESERKRANLAQMLDETLGLLQHQLGQRIKVKKSYANVPAVDCYPRRLNQVFYTLIRRAAESIEGQGSIAITLETVEKAVRLKITDSGRGIAAERLSHLFEIELRPEQSRVRAAMDLAICRSIVQKHGGRIAAESDPGQGTTFCITLPVLASPTLA